jgi:hypothetical protein
VIAGEARQHFDVDADTITLASRYFKWKASINWKKPIVLPMDIVQGHIYFSVYLNWVQTREIDLERSEEEEDDQERNNEEYGIQFIRLWILAEFLEDTACKDATMDHLKLETSIGAYDAARDIPDIFDTVPLDSGLGRWLVDCIINDITRPSDAFLTGLKPEVLVAVIDRLAEMHNAVGAWPLGNNIEEYGDSYYERQREGKVRVRQTVSASTAAVGIAFGVQPFRPRGH